MTNKLVLENVKYRPLRALLSALLIGVPVTLILVIVGLSEGLREESARRARGVGADILIRPPGSSVLTLSTAPMPERLVTVLSKRPHVTVATGTVVQMLEGPFNNVTGIDLKSFNEMSGGFVYLEGGPFQYPNDILVDEYYARQKKVHAGDTIDVLNRNWRVAGIVEQGKLARMFLPLKVLQDLTGNTGRVSQIYLKVDNPSNVQAVIESLRKDLPGYPIYSMDEFTSLITVTKVEGLSEFISVIIAISIVIGFTVVLLSMYMAVLQRTREIGILKSLGASRWYILSLILREAFLIAIGGAVIGIVLSFGARWLIQKLVPATLTVNVVPEWWLIAAMITMFGALIGALYPGLRAALQDPIEALAYE